MNDLEFPESYFSTNYHFQAPTKPTPTSPLPASSGPGTRPAPQTAAAAPDLGVAGGRGGAVGPQGRIRAGRAQGTFFGGWRSTTALGDALGVGPLAHRARPQRLPP